MVQPLVSDLDGFMPDMPDLVEVRVGDNPSPVVIVVEAARILAFGTWQGRPFSQISVGARRESALCQLLSRPTQTAIRYVDGDHL
jgi:hypothetical protein